MEHLGRDLTPDISLLGKGLGKRGMCHSPRATLIRARGHAPHCREVRRSLLHQPILTFLGWRQTLGRPAPRQALPERPRDP